MMSYKCFYSGHEEENSAKRRFENLFSIIMNPLESDGFAAISFVQVAFTYYVETRDALIRS